MKAKLFLSLLAAVLPKRAVAMTPEQMLSAPRRSEAIPSPDGTLAIFSQSVYSFKEHERTTTWHLMRVNTGEISKLPFNGTETSEIFWVGPQASSILYINSTNNDIPGGVTLWLSDALSPASSTQVGSLPAPYSGLRAVNTPSGDINFLVTSLAYPNGTAYNEELEEPAYSTGRLYESIFVRHWDTWLTQQRYALFSGKLLKRQASHAYSNGSAAAPYSLANTTLTNLLSGIDASVTRAETPVQPYGGSTDYDITPDGKWVAFLTKAPELPKSNYTASYIYLVPSDGSVPATAINGPGSRAQARGHLGASAAPKFSPDGKFLAYAQMDGISYESDRAKIYVAGVGSDGVTSWDEVAQNWDRWASAMQWSPDSSQIWVSSEDLGSIKLFPFPRDAEDSYEPTNATAPESSVSSFYILPDGRALVSATGIHTSMNYYTVGSDGTTNMLLEANKADPELQGLGPHTVSEFYYTGSQGVPIQSWIVKPSNYEEGKKYPLAFLVHGGPESAWDNSWSSRWNLQTWADQGYIVVAPNPTGSTGFGQKLVDAIQNNWGSYPYEDLVLAWNYVAENLTDVDTDNGIEAGASYGGYMTNWIQGHDLGRKFRALVTHDGSTSTLNQYASEELWFMQHDFNGTLWNDRPNYEAWDPIAHAVNFSTPHFVVHNELDYRLPVSEGIMLFNVLQERGVPSRFLSFPDENHWVLDPENSRIWHKEIYNWINFWSGVGGPLNDDAITN